MLYFDRPFSIGDWISSPDQNIEGAVVEIGWRLTQLKIFDAFVANISLLLSYVIFDVRNIERRQRIMIDFQGDHFTKSVILYTVCFYVQYSFSSRDLDEVMAAASVIYVLFAVIFKTTKPPRLAGGLGLFKWSMTRHGH